MPLAKSNAPAANLPLGCEARCPACKHRHLSESQSLDLKQDWLKKALAPWSGALAPVRSQKKRLGYRRKTLLHARYEDGWKFGMLLKFGRDEEQFVAIPNCPVHSKEINELLGALGRILPRDLPLVFVSVTQGLVTLVLKTAASPDLSHVDWASSGACGVYLNLNPSAGRRVFFPRGWMHLWGEKLTGGLFVSGPAGFQQLIQALYEDALGEAERFLSVAQGDQVLDLYSGVGVSLSRWKKAGARALGVELSGEAVESAKLNLGEDVVLRGRVSERIPQMSAWLGEGRVVVFANPPRLGMEPEVIDWLSREVKPDAIAYLSCSAGTLSRDLSNLVQAGYAVQELIPYDFFPQTHHVETLALLRLENPTSDHRL